MSINKNVKNIPKLDSLGIFPKTYKKANIIPNIFTKNIFNKTNLNILFVCSYSFEN